MPIFRNKYLTHSHRLPNWNYSTGWYFVTICTKDRISWLGEIRGNVVGLSLIGNLVAKEWQKNPYIRKHLILDKWIIMPNHLHGIIVLQSDNTETQSSASLQSKNKFGPQSKNLASIIRGFKSTTTSQIRRIFETQFAWQSNYYEHVIRSDKSLDAIREYIESNPSKWKLDNENPHKV